MKLSINEDLAQLLSQIRRLAVPNKIWLVGGAVRDLLLGKAVKDLDFVMADGSARLAKKVRKHFEGVSYSLDDERQTARVILRMGEPDELIMDFASFIGENLEEDLRQRDFTINSMAVDLDDLNQVYDPLSGMDDLEGKKLRLSCPNSLNNDPLRVIRLVRMLRTYGLEIDSETKELMRIAVKSLDRISGERIRDELLKCLKLSDWAETSMLLDESGILKKMLELAGYQPVVADFDLSNERFEESIKILTSLEKMLDDIKNGNKSSKYVAFLAEKETSEDLFANLDNMLSEPIQAGRSRGQLLVLFTLFFSLCYKKSELSSSAVCQEKVTSMICEEFAKKLSQFFVLGAKEEKYTESVCRGFFSILDLEKLEEVQKLDIYRFFKPIASFGLESALLQIAIQPVLDEPEQKTVELSRKIILTWFLDQESVVNPPRLVDGISLQQTLKLKPGPLMGDYLEAVREAQVMGAVKTEEEAIEFVKGLMSEVK